MTRTALFLLISLALPAISGATAPDPLLWNALEVVDELPDGQARDFAERAGLYPAERTVFQRLFRPRFSPAAPNAAPHEED